MVEQNTLDPWPGEQGRRADGASAGGRTAANVWPCLKLAARSTVKTALAVIVLAGVAVLTAMVAFRYVDPPGSMLMLTRYLAGHNIDQRWAPIESISPALVRAVIVSEDNQFCSHHGVDFRELKEAIDRAERTGDEYARGGSTISMQLTKNMFLWPDKSYVRKAIEMPLTMLLELVWPKRRILEVYLNVAEWGPGIFGAEAAARHHFRKSAAALSEREATLLAVALPNPFIRVPSRPTPNLLRVASVVERRARAVGTARARCVLGN